jgi:hypothetical protein
MLQRCATQHVAALWNATQHVAATQHACQLFVKHLLLPLPPTSISTRAEVLSLFGGAAAHSIRHSHGSAWRDSGAAWASTRPPGNTDGTQIRWWGYPEGGRQFGRACTALVWKDPEMGQCVVELLAGTTTAEEMLKQGIVWTDMIYGKTVVDGRRHLR